MGAATPEERAFEAALRPRTLDELIGQERVREQLSLMLEAAVARGRTPDHVLHVRARPAWARPRSR